MRLSWRDGVATGCVGAAAVVYGIWLSNDEVVGVSSARGIGTVVLVLGLAASVTAVVFGVGEGLLRASKTYLAITSTIGLIALVAGIVVLVNENGSMLAALVASTAVLWAASTVRHAIGTRRRDDHAIPGTA